MIGFAAGIATGCLIGVSGTFLLILLSTSLPSGQKYWQSEVSPRGIVLAVMTVLAVAGLAHILHVHKAGSLLILLLTVLLISRGSNTVTGLTSAAVAAIVAALFFLPPVGSFRIAHPQDRLALAIFLLISVVGARLVRSRGTQKSI